MHPHTQHRSSILDQLRIYRPDDGETGSRFWPWLLGVTALAIGITAAAWFLLTIPPAVLVDVATAADWQGSLRAESWAPEG